MREILFRGKRVDNGEWKYGYYATVVINGKVYSAIDTVFNNRFVTPTIVYPETVGEYTGLTDKNGKSIFEGDIVKEWSAWWRTPQKVERNTFEVVCKHLGTLLLIRKKRGGEESKTLNRKSSVEVIGNIHDNPELLEVEE